MGCRITLGLLYCDAIVDPMTIPSRGCDTGLRVPNLIHARALPAAVIAIAFAILARAMGAVTDGGALAGVLIAFLLMLPTGVTGFVPLLSVFVLTLISTRWGYKRKQRLGVAETRRGRTASQVLANLSAAAVCVVPVIWVPKVDDLLLVASAAALAEAAADTVSSEVGQATARAAYLITDFRDVPVGTNGAISVEGTLSGCVAACIVAWVSAVVGWVDWSATPVIALAATAGMFLDSVMGATWENSGKLGNDAVNFISTVFAADLALIITMIMQRV
ncbi:MAG TPA: DUF92 domain-containing protein [Candidatus Binataceae bacterium]|nr:DUF92 domain-containing protein [Candidatus Binataceae bacterium]